MAAPSENLAAVPNGNRAAPPSRHHISPPDGHRAATPPRHRAATPPRHRAAVPSRHCTAVDRRLATLTQRTRPQNKRPPQGARQPAIATHINRHMRRGDRPAVRRMVRAIIRTMGAPVSDDDPVGLLTLPSQPGRPACTAFALQKSIDMLETACAFCQQLENVTCADGIVTRLFCDSCRIRIGDRHRCPGTCETGCGSRRWATPLGIPSTVCIDCDRALKSVAHSGCAGNFCSPRRQLNTRTPMHLRADMGVSMSIADGAIVPDAAPPPAADTSAPAVPAAATPAPPPAEAAPAETVPATPADMFQQRAVSTCRPYTAEELQIHMRKRTTNDLVPYGSDLVLTPGKKYTRVVVTAACIEDETWVLPGCIHQLPTIETDPPVLEFWAPVDLDIDYAGLSDAAHAVETNFECKFEERQEWTSNAPGNHILHLIATGETTTRGIMTFDPADVPDMKLPPNVGQHCDWFRSMTTGDVHVAVSAPYMSTPPLPLDASCSIEIGFMDPGFMADRAGAIAVINSVPWQTAAARLQPEAATGSPE
jgi:hypothetical protein